MNILRRSNSKMPETAPFDVSKLEDEIGKMIPHRTEPPLVTLAGGRGGTADIGSITAEAIATQHDEAANAITALGNELKEVFNEVEQIKAEVQLALKDCLDLAEEYRAAGRKSSERLRHTAKLTANVRATCRRMREELKGNGANGAGEVRSEDEGASGDGD